MTTKRCVVKETSVFPIPAETMWSMLAQLQTLQYVAAPYARFVPVGDEKQIVWRQGAEFAFRFYLFGWIPLGIHTIKILEFNGGSHRIYSEESNRHVPVWNHTVILRRVDGDTTEYTDVVELGAGWKTAMVKCWARAFYRHRQRKWKKLLRRCP